ncbi:MAG TPA: hypothetical protein VL404_07815, partial [Candidatus Eisenbacteria bacterium]|nr:hypothetical protein [Candidatus Eisenbacteria bacterium]
WERSFRIGSTKDEVLAVQGPPTYTAGEQWYYGNDIVTFSGGRVAAFSNVSGSLKVSRRTSSETNNQLNLIK